LGCGLDDAGYRTAKRQVNRSAPMLQPIHLAQVWYSPKMGQKNYIISKLCQGSQILLILPIELGNVRTNIIHQYRQVEIQNFEIRLKSAYFQPILPKID